MTRYVRNHYGCPKCTLSWRKPFCPLCKTSLSNEPTVRNEISEWEYLDGLRQERENSYLSQTSLPGGLRPAPQPDMTPMEFERYCLAWMVYLGEKDAKQTRYSRDGGYDLYSSKVLAQVKFQTTPVGVSPLRELMGLALARNLSPWFFSVSSYSSVAISESNEYGVALFTVDPLRGHIAFESSAAKNLN